MARAKPDMTTESGRHATQRLRDEIIVWLTTVRPSGQPDTVPVWYLWQDDTVLIYSRPDKQKLGNIAGNPRVSVVVDDTHGGGDVIRIEGAAEIVPDAPLCNAIPAYVAKYGEHIKRIGHDADSFARAYSVAIRVTPSKISA